MSESVQTQLRDALRDSPGLIANLVAKLREGLDATLVKTCSHQGTMTWETFVDYPTRLAYIKAINDIAQLSVADFSQGEGTELRVVNIGTNSNIAAQAADFVLPAERNGR